MAGKISEYPSSITTLASGDLFDVSEFLNPGYESKKLDWSTLLTELNSQITFANIYTTDGTTTGQRTISIGTNDLIFGSTGDTNLLRFDATADRIGIGIAAPNEKLHVNGNSQLAGQLSVNDNVNADVQMLLSTTLRDGINVGNTNSTGTQSSSIIGRNLSTHASGQATALRGTVQNNTTSGINVAVEGRALSTGTNYGAWFEAIGGLNNYALITGGGDVGIGTTTPTQKLEVVGNTKINGTTFISVSGGINALEVRSFNSAVLGLSQDNNANVIHDQFTHLKQSVTLGTTITGVGKLLKIDNDWKIEFGNTTIENNIAGANETIFKNATGDFIFRDAVGNSVNFEANASGGSFAENIGIGTATPTEKLEVVGNLLLSGTRTLKFSTFADVTSFTNGGIELQGSGSTNLLHFTDTGATKMFVGQTKGMFTNIGGDADSLGLRNDVGNIHFGFSNNSVMTLLSSGNLGIGTTAPTNKLEVVGNTDSTTYSVNGTAGANFSGAVTNITVVNGIVTAVS